MPQLNTNTVPEEPQPGSVWSHYKDIAASPKRYEVIGVAKHTETEEVVVVYRALYGDHNLWTRPLAMWHARVIVNQPWPDGVPTERDRFVLMPNVTTAAAGSMASHSCCTIM